MSFRLVIATLTKMEKERKCYRMIGGVLCEQTVGVVLPIIGMQEKRLGELIENLQRQLVAKGLELVAYKEQYNVRVKGVDAPTDVPGPESKPSSSGVLVS